MYYNEPMRMALTSVLVASAITLADFGMLVVGRQAIAAQQKFIDKADVVDGHFDPLPVDTVILRLVLVSLLTSAAIVLAGVLAQRREERCAAVRSIPAQVSLFSFLSAALLTVSLSIHSKDMMASGNLILGVNSVLRAATLFSCVTLMYTVFAAAMRPITSPSLRLLANGGCIAFAIALRVLTINVIE